MDRKHASKLLEEQLPLIFSWSMAKVYNKTDAEDLAQEIVYRVLCSVERLEKDEAFWGYVWKIAENTLRTNIRKKQWEKCMNAMADAVMRKCADEDNEELIRLIEEGFIKSENGVLAANFPVFVKAELEHVKEALAPIVDLIFACILEICAIAEETLKDYVPNALKNDCGHLANVHYQVDSAAQIMEEMVRRGMLTVPEEKVNMCMYAVKK